MSKKKDSLYRKPKKFFFFLMRFMGGIITRFVWKLKVLRNELKHKKIKRGCVILCNHETSWDFFNLIRAVKQDVTFVMSNAYYSTLGLKSILDGIAVIPKNQFQTSLIDMKKMKAVIDNNKPLCIYPCGLNPENGMDTGLPPATAKFVKWLNCDVYVARSYCSFFIRPKWNMVFRKGKCFLDIYKLHSKEEMQELSVDQIEKELHKHLDFDAYIEQEKFMSKFKGMEKATNIEYVLYECPKCHKIHTMKTEDNKIYCTECGFTQTFDQYGFMHNENKEEEIRHLSDWVRMIQNNQLKEMKENPDYGFEVPVTVQTVDPKKGKFVDNGRGIVKLKNYAINLKGTVNNEEVDYTMNLKQVPSMPFNPTQYFEIQDNKTIYRCVPDDKFVITPMMNYVTNEFKLEKENASI